MFFKENFQMLRFFVFVLPDSGSDQLLGSRSRCHSLPLQIREVFLWCASNGLEFQRERFLGKSVERKVKDKTA